ncbi:hypothetical protein LCGC14_2123260, partial [marine sediment metagenome]
MSLTAPAPLPGATLAWPTPLEPISTSARAKPTGGGPTAGGAQMTAVKLLASAVAKAANIEAPGLTTTGYDSAVDVARTAVTVAPTVTVASPDRAVA